jgi:hypothetical protein
MNHAQNRFDIFALINAVRVRIEQFYATILQIGCGKKYRGKFDVSLTNPNKLTIRVLNSFCVKGVVKFYPDNATDYKHLNDLCESDGGINLSNALLIKGRPEQIPVDDWSAVTLMLKDVTTVLRDHGIVPIHQLVGEAQRSLGYGAPKINKKFGGDCDPIDEQPHAISDVMKMLIEKLDVLEQAA